MKKMKMRFSGRSESLERSSAQEAEGASASGSQRPKPDSKRPQQRYKKFSLNYLFAANRERDLLLQNEQLQTSSGSTSPHPLGTPQCRSKTQAVGARRSVQSSAAAKGGVLRADSQPDLVLCAAPPLPTQQQQGPSCGTPTPAAAAALMQRPSLSHPMETSPQPQNSAASHKCITYRSAAGGEARVIPLPFPTPTGNAGCILLSENVGGALSSKSRTRKTSTVAGVGAAALTTQVEPRGLHRNTLGSSDMLKLSSKKRSSGDSVASSLSEQPRRQSSSDTAASGTALAGSSAPVPAPAAAARKSLPHTEQTQRLQRQVEDVSLLMHANVARVMERSARLEDLERCSSSLEQSVCNHSLLRAVLLTL